MGFPERLSQSVVTGTLEQNDLKLMPVDFVGSLSGASALGSDIFRAADGDAFAFRRAILLLAREATRKFRIGQSVAVRLASVAIQEVIYWQCRKCNGAGQVIAGELKVICDKCGGTGIHRWSDAERAKLLKVNNWSQWDKRYTDVLAIAANDFSRVVGCANKKLG